MFCCGNYNGWKLHIQSLQKRHGAADKDAQTTAEQLTEDDSTPANTDDILPTDTDSEEDNAENQESQKDVQQENENSMENGNTSTEEIQSTASSNTQNVWFTQESTLAWAGKRSNTFEF